MIFSKGHFRSTRLSKSFINESLNGVKNFSSQNAHDSKTTVFLSHKHKDLEEEEEATGVIDLLERQNTRVYIDSMDNKMPKQTSGDTAARIKDIIEYCDKFILLATPKAIESYWCNWELGIGDVHKLKKNNIAVLPVKEKNQLDIQYKGNEYLQIYPHIQYYNGNSFYRNSQKKIEQGYYVAAPKDKNGNFTIEKLEYWLKN